MARDQWKVTKNQGRIWGYWLCLTPGRRGWKRLWELKENKNWRTEVVLRPENGYDGPVCICSVRVAKMAAGWEDACVCWNLRVRIRIAMVRRGPGGGAEVSVDPWSWGCGGTVSVLKGCPCCGQKRQSLCGKEDQARSWRKGRQLLFLSVSSFGKSPNILTMLAYCWYSPPPATIY